MKRSRIYETIEINQLYNLNVGDEYQESDRVQIGNGASLDIFHYGTSILTAYDFT